MIASLSLINQTVAASKVWSSVQLWQRPRATIEAMRLRHNMCVRGVRLRDFSHLEWQKLNIKQYSSGSLFAAFSLEVKQVRQTCSV